MSGLNTSIENIEIIWDSMMKSTIIAITGMTGAGKAVASSVAEEMGLPVFVCGDVIRNEAKTRGIPATAENLGKLMFEIREKEGRGAVALRLLPKIRSEKGDFVVIEGFRNIEEVKELRKYYKVIILGIHSSPEQRFNRLKQRKRSDDPGNWNDFVKKDERELKVGIGNVIALSDIMAINGSTLEKFKEEIRRILLNLCNSNQQ